ncbi:histidine phosphatase family protein [Polaribacter sp. KT 15]|uniref:SixA phosphatase family protein n=1 Tax=Polaribacter sp. KT 15 TaxID=1896175 RepID=UPI000909EC32|nr:phosphoglycerate mutase family protein [Polaribacter sp. KT 15]SHN07594.1 Broad specificity phosphatase PhoE [Polaribacter sp. KT 15]
MKKYILVFSLIFSLLVSCNSQETTTYYLIRHAEKDRTDSGNKNPDLNENGLKRAKKWAEYFKNIDLDAVYSTSYNRTQQTAKPTADSKNLNITSYNPGKMYDSVFKANTKGKTVLIVGHSNTTPVFANKILGKKMYENMSDNDNASLLIVTISGDDKTSKIEKID